MRLTKELKEKLKDKVIKEKLKKPISIIDEKISAIAQEEADRMFGKDFKEWASKAKTGWLSTINSIILYTEEGREFSLPKTYRYLSKIDQCRAITLKSGIKVPATHTYRVEAVVSKRNAAKLKEISKEIHGIEKRIGEISSVITQALASVNTDKQLQENYPELAKYLQAPDTQGKMLTVTNEDVKKVLS